MSDRLIVIVPVLDRPQNVEPLVASFYKGCPDTARLVFSATWGDDAEKDAIERVMSYRVQVSPTASVTWPEKINETYREIHDRNLADWVLFGADDIDFHEGWWDATKPFRDQPEIMVIGTNDLGNPRVIAGEHTTHALVRSSYIGTIDDPTSIVHTGYQHWCVDDEFLWTAKLRGVWAFCPTAIVEHFHPYWEKGKWDATYAKGEANSAADMALWRERAPLLGLQVNA